MMIRKRVVSVFGRKRLRSAARKVRATVPRPQERGEEHTLDLDTVELDALDQQLDEALS